MSTFSLLLTDAQQIPPEGLMAIGILCLLVGIWFSIAVFSDALRASVSWGQIGGGPPVSRLGASGFALTMYLFALLSFAHALGWIGVYSFIFYLLMAVFFLTVLVSVRDWTRSRKDI